MCLSLQSTRHATAFLFCLREMANSKYMHYVILNELETVYMGHLFSPTTGLDSKLLTQNILKHGNVFKKNVN